jgi:chromosome segregation ATPase
MPAWLAAVIVGVVVAAVVVLVQSRASGPIIPTLDTRVATIEESQKDLEDTVETIGDTLQETVKTNKQLVETATYHGQYLDAIQVQLRGIQTLLREQTSPQVSAKIDELVDIKKKLDELSEATTKQPEAEMPTRGEVWALTQRAEELVADIRECKERARKAQATANAAWYKADDARKHSSSVANAQNELRAYVRDRVPSTQRYSTYRCY